MRSVVIAHAAIFEEEEEAIDGSEEDEHNSELNLEYTIIEKN